MKMTRLEWRYLQKIALDHPYFDTHELPLTEKEADAIVKANIRMTGKEFVDSIYAQLGMTRPSEEKKPFAWLRSIGEQFTVPPIRKVVISVLVVLLLTVFFAATPMGQAIAESVIQYIATLFEDGELIIKQSDKDASLVYIENIDEFNDYEQQDNQSEIVYANSFDDFIEATGKEPFKLSLKCTELYFEYDETIDYLALYATYEMPDEKIVTYQIWDVEDLESSTLSGFTMYNTDESIYYSIEKEGRIIIKKVFDDSILEINAKGSSYNLDDLIRMVKEG